MFKNLILQFSRTFLITVIGVLVALFQIFSFTNVAFAQVPTLPAGTRADYPVGAYPYGIAFDNVTNSVWVTNFTSNFISKIDITNGVRVDYPVGSWPHGVAFDNITNSIWVTNSNSGTVSKVDIFTGTKADYHVGAPGGSWPTGVAFDNITNSVWVANEGSNTVSKVDINTGSRNDYVVGSSPFGVAFDNITNSVWVTNIFSDTVSKVDIFTGARVDYPAGSWPYGVAFDNVTNSVWVTNENSNTISRTNIYTGDKIYYTVGLYPIGLAFDNSTNSVWVTTGGSNSISKVNISTGTRADYPVGVAPHGIAFDNVTNSVWVTNYYSNTVSKVAIGGPWQPTQFFSQVKNTPNNWSIRKTQGTQNKPTDDIIKFVPNDWVLKVISTTDTNGANVDLPDGYRWYQVKDVTDDSIGWMQAKNLASGVEYLSYDANAQSSFDSKATTTQYQTRDARIPVVISAVDNYFTQANTINSLYGGGGGVGGKNDFQRFIQGSQFPKELVLAIIGQESGIVNFDNEIVTYDYGHGIMQSTFAASSTNKLMNTWDNRGVGSDVTIPLCKSIFSNDYKKCYANSSTPNNLLKPYQYYDGNPVNPIYKQNANTFQSIYANIKDGFRVIQDKYRKKCPKADILISGFTFTCQDIEKMLNVWGYNGFGKNRKTGLYTGTYLKDVAGKLENISSYFPGVTYTDATFVQKMKIADAHKQVVRVYSPVTFNVIDSAGRITGLVNDSLFEDIPNSLYERNSEGAVIFFPSGIYRYRVVGIEAGTYKFFVDDTNGDVLHTFHAIDIPTTAGEVHEYLIDWDALDRGERGVTVLIDTNGDGIFDRTVLSDGTLTEIVPPTITIASPAGEYLFNATTTVQFSVSDASGIATTSATLNGVAVTNGQVITFRSPGRNILEVSAMDTEGNTATTSSVFMVVYNIKGFLSPLKSNETTEIHNGSTIPVKFKLLDSNGKSVSKTKAFLYIAKITNGIVGIDEIPHFTTDSDDKKISNEFRYDTEGRLYILNLSTKTMAPGMWQIKAVLDSGQEIKARVLIK